MTKNVVAKSLTYYQWPGGQGKHSNPSPDWLLTFEDTFPGAANSAPDSSKWVNPYTDNDYPKWAQKIRSDDAYLDGSGQCIIRSQRRNVGGASYTAGQIATDGKFSQTGGKFEVVAQMPAGGSGIWPGIWLLGDNWPHGGEIDILEMFGGTMDNAQFNYHFWNGSAPDSVGDSYQDSALATGLHTWGVEWDPGEEIRWYVDQILRWTYTNANVSSSPMYFVLDQYLGGFTGDPSGTTFPQYMPVKSVRAWQRP